VFEKILANVASKCEIAYGGMGRVGFVYVSMKDQLRWEHLSVKKYINIVSQVGSILSMSDKNYDKNKVEHSKMSDKAIGDVFLKAFGDGK